MKHLLSNIESKLCRVAIYLALMISAPNQDRIPKVIEDNITKTSTSNFYRGSILDDNGFIIYK